MAPTELESLWKSVFPDRSRPRLYASEAYGEDGFLPLTDHKDFIVDIHALTPQQLYAFSSNSQAALKAAQDEYLELEHQINLIKNPDPTNQQPIKNPQALLESVEHEQRKEALLYGYKYDGKRFFGNKKLSELTDMEKRDLRMDQDPFAQGGFVPNDRQYKAAKTKARHPNNIDGWVPISKNGQKLVPKMFVETPTDHAERYNITRSKAATTIAHPIEQAATEDVFDDGSGTTSSLPVNKLLRVTRFNGTKVPMRRDDSEEPSYPPSRSSTPKRKRGDTPIPSIEGGSPLKKIRGSEVDEPPKRRRHNQYTKAKERREQAEAEAATRTITGTSGEIPDRNVSARLNGAHLDQGQSFSRSTTTEPQYPATPPLRRRRHNQYTKARERAQLAAAAETASQVRTSEEYADSAPLNGYDTNTMDSSAIAAANQNDGRHHHYYNHSQDQYRQPQRHSHLQYSQPTASTDMSSQPQKDADVPFKSRTPQSAAAATVVSENPGHGSNKRPSTTPVAHTNTASTAPVWANMTPTQKLHHKWDSESLIAAIKEDYTWLPEENDALKRAERDRLLAQKNPHRSFSIKNKWRFWKKEGLDKRPRKNKLVVLATSGNGGGAGGGGAGASVGRGSGSVATGVGISGTGRGPRNLGMATTGASHNSGAGIHDYSRYRETPPPTSGGQLSESESEDEIAFHGRPANHRPATNMNTAPIAGGRPVTKTGAGTSMGPDFNHTKMPSSSLPAVGGATTNQYKPSSSLLAGDHPTASSIATRPPQNRRTTANYYSGYSTDEDDDDDDEEEDDDDEDNGNESDADFVDTIGGKRTGRGNTGGNHNGNRRTSARTTTAASAAATTTTTTTTANVMV